jgi:hypothetical protein
MRAGVRTPDASTEYTVSCGGTVTFAGSVPDVITKPNDFSCDYDSGYRFTECDADHSTGYHVAGYADFSVSD